MLCQNNPHFLESVNFGVFFVLTPNDATFAGSFEKLQWMNL